MTNIFVIADLHIGHAATWEKFKKDDGSPLRPYSSTEEMNEVLRDNWNSVVGPSDKVYVLGDLCMSHKHLGWYSTVNGDKVLVKGNHDIYGTSKYLANGFRDIRGCHVHEKFVLTHIPIHPQSLERWRGNIHGHLHSNEVLLANNRPDPSYLCVSVEQPWVGFKPMAWEDVLLKFNERNGVDHGNDQNR